MSEKGRFRGHIYRVCLPAELYFSTMKFQVDKQLGKAFAGLQLFIAGLFHYDYIDKETFDLYTARYSEPLMSNASEPLTKTQIEREKKLQDLETRFSNAIKQWNSMHEDSKEYYIKKAKKYETVVSNAKLILALANGEKFTNY